LLHSTSIINHNNLIFVTQYRKIAPEAICEKLPAGSIVIFRDYDDPKRTESAVNLHKLCKSHNLFLLIGKSPELAQKIGADGVHFPEFMTAQISKWKKLKPHWLFSSSCHSETAIIKSLSHGADILLFSPIFATSSHPDAEPQNIIRSNRILRNIAQKTEIKQKIYALGGIDAKNLKFLKNTLFSGVAISSGLLNCCHNATDLQQTLRDLKKK